MELLQQIARIMVEILLPVIGNIQTGYYQHEN